MISIPDRSRSTFIQESVIILRECHHIAPHPLAGDIMCPRVEPLLEIPSNMHLIMGAIEEVPKIQIRVLPALLLICVMKVPIIELNIQLLLISS
jgi:hypothetical protein